MAEEVDCYDGVCKVPGEANKISTSTNSDMTNVLCILIATKLFYYVGLFTFRGYPPVSGTAHTHIVLRYCVRLVPVSCPTLLNGVALGPRRYNDAVAHSARQKVGPTQH